MLISNRRPYVIKSIMTEQCIIESLFSISDRHRDWKSIFLPGVPVGISSRPMHQNRKTRQTKDLRRRHVFLILSRVICCQDLSEAWPRQLSKKPVYLFRWTRYIFFDPPYQYTHQRACKIMSCNFGFEGTIFLT